MGQYWNQQTEKNMHGTVLVKKQKKVGLKKFIGIW